MSAAPSFDARPLRTLLIPKTYSTAAPSPLLLVLHGYGSDGASHARMFALGDLAEKERVIVAAPDGTMDRENRQRFWNAVPSCCDFEDVGVDDVSYLKSVVSDLRSKFVIDPKRIFVVGHSNGGAMALRLACDASDVFAAVVSLAGPFFEDFSRCRPSVPVAVRLIHGENDAVVPYDGGALRPIHSRSNRKTPSAGDIAAFFAKTNGCLAASRVEAGEDVEMPHSGSGTLRIAYDACKENATVDLLSVKGMGHGPSRVTARWPEVFYGFLRAHPKP